MLNHIAPSPLFPQTSLGDTPQPWSSQSGYAQSIHQKLGFL